MIAVGDVQLEMVLCLTLRGTVRELAAFIEALTSSEVVVGFGQADSDGKKGEGISEPAKQFCSGTGEHNKQ